MKTFDLSRTARDAGIESNSHGALYDNINQEDTRIILSDTESKILLKGHIILMCIDGELTFSTGSGQHQCKAGSICILVKDSYCIFHSVSDDCKMAVLTSQTNAFHLVASSLPNLMLFFRHFRENPVHITSGHELEDALNIYHSLKTMAGRPEYPFQKQIIQAYDVAMFYILFAQVRQDHGTSSQTRQSVIYDTFLNDVSRHFREERKLEYYAGLQCITPKHLAYAVKKESGISPHKWICDFVMIEARELLSDKKNSVQDVADMLHFTDQSIFGKYFKTHEGLSPLQYQQQPR